MPTTFDRGLVTLLSLHNVLAELSRAATSLVRRDPGKIARPGGPVVRSRKNSAWLQVSHEGELCNADIILWRLRLRSHSLPVFGRTSAFGSLLLPRLPALQRQRFCRTLVRARGELHPD